MIRKEGIFSLAICLSLLFSVVHVLVIPNASTKAMGTGELNAGGWLEGWEFMKQHNITRSPLGEIPFFYGLSPPWTTILGNPTDRHTFQPVHTTTIVEVNKTVDGVIRKYLAYDSDPVGSEIRLYFTDDINGSWTGYSENPILGPNSNNYRWPSVTYVDGKFQMFLDSRTQGALERWSSTDGVHFAFEEKIKLNGYPLNPFIWHNPTNNQWCLYSHESFDGTEYIVVRSTASIEDLDQASDTRVISREGSIGSPTVMYLDGQYWLLAEVYMGRSWKTVAFYSTTSSSSGFKECYNSPILSNDEACPMLFLNPSKTQAYLFSNKDSSAWYQYTREVYINTNPLPPLENLYNYQVRIIAHYGSGTDSGEHVYLNGHSRTDFGDVRFMWLNSSSQSEIECDYWIEELEIGGNGKFWVRIPEISNAVNNTIDIYYGKNDAGTTSDGEKTFEFFDDFSGTLSKWTVVGGTWQIENGELSGETGGFGQRLRANSFSFSNHAVHVKVEWISGRYFENGPYVRGQLPNEGSAGYMAFLSTWSGDQRQRISRMLGGPYGQTIASQGGTDPSKNVWYEFAFKLYGERLKTTMSPIYSAEISGIDSSFYSGTLCLFSWSASSEHVHFDDLFVRQYVEPEPSHASWGREERDSRVVIDQALVSDARADVGSNQTIELHASWNNNGSDVRGGSIYVNHTEYVANNTGWISLNVSSLGVEKDSWAVTGVNCSGETRYVSAIQIPSITWDRMRITGNGLTKESIMLGDTVTVWFTAIYEYDSKIFNSSSGELYLNGSAMAWSPAENRWEYVYVANTSGAQAFVVTKVHDVLFNLTVLTDEMRVRIVSVWATPFMVTSNSTISDLTFNSTSKTLSFTATGYSGTIGSTNVTIQKTLIENVDGLKVYLDGSEIAHTTISYEYSWLIRMTYTHSTHKVAISLDQFPDLDGDGKVNKVDIVLVSRAYGLTSISPNWNPACDLDHNGIINIVDLYIVAKDFGKTI